MTTGDNLKVEVFRHPNNLPEDAAAFLSEGEQISVQFGASWYRNLVDTVFPAHEGVCLYLLRRAGRPVAALPLLVHKAGLGSRVEALANYYTAVYAPVLAPDLETGELAVLLRAVRRQHRGLASLTLSPMDPESPAYAQMRNAMGVAGLKPFAFYCFGNWYEPVRADWQAYLMARKATLRNTIKRLGARFVQDGGTLELIKPGQGDVERALQAYERVYASSWKTAEPYPGFVQGLVRTCADRGWLRMGVAWLKDEPIAAQIWIVANGKADIYKVAYDEQHKVYSPGTLVTALLMQDAIEHNAAKEIDYLIGDDSYKKNWMSERRERWGLVAYNPRSLGGQLGWARESLGRRLKPWLAKWKAHKAQSAPPAK